MIELLESDIRTNDRKSSKGNQLKWLRNERWYKADYTGYEGLAEYVVSCFLRRSTLKEDQFVVYRTEEMSYKGQRFLGCSSPHFLHDGEQLVTWERLYQQTSGRSLQADVFQFPSVPDRLAFLTGQMERASGLTGIMDYLAALFVVDAVFLNEDRHMHNLAFVLDDSGTYHFCPLFDHGGCLLSDTTLEYPLGGDIHRLAKDVMGRTVSHSLDEQLDLVEEIRPDSLKFNLSRSDAEQMIRDEPYYSAEIKSRVTEIVSMQMRKYSYLFI